MLIGGPLGDDRVLLVIEATDAAAVRERLGEDPWSRTLLEVASVEPYEILLRH